MNESSLVGLLKKDDASAFDAIFQVYSQKVYYFSLGYLKSEKDAEEVVQQTFLKLWEKHADIDPKLSLHSYIFKIAFNYIQKRLIKILKENELKHNLADELVHFDDQTSQMVNYHFLLEHVNRLISELPPRQQEIVELRKIKGYSLKEISAQLNISVKTVEAHMRTALKSLKQQLKSERFDDLLLWILIAHKKFS